MLPSDRWAHNLPLPWAATRLPGGHEATITSANGKLIADCQFFDEATLLAGAPILLQELERMYEAARCMADPEHCLHGSRDAIPWAALAKQAKAALDACEAP